MIKKHFSSMMTKWVQEVIAFHVAPSGCLHIQQTHHLKIYAFSQSDILLFIDTIFVICVFWQEAHY